MTRTVNIVVTKGTTKKFDIPFKIPIDITNPAHEWKVHLTVKAYPSDSNKLIDNEGDLDEQNKVGSFEVTPDENNLNPRSYYYDVNLESEPLDRRFPLIKGKYVVVDSVRY